MFESTSQLFSGSHNTAQGFVKLGVVPRLSQTEKAKESAGPCTFRSEDV